MGRNNALMRPIFLEVIVNEDDMLAGGIESRDEIEDPLREALRRAGIGEVTGGGGGMGEVNIDVDVNLVISEEDAVNFLRTTLRSLRVPQSTVIVRHQPEEREYRVWN